jgi:hypothetical protein
VSEFLFFANPSDIPDTEAAASKLAVSGEGGQRGLTTDGDEVANGQHMRLSSADVNILTTTNDNTGTGVMIFEVAIERIFESHVGDVEYDCYIYIPDGRSIIDVHGNQLQSIPLREAMQATDVIMPTLEGFQFVTSEDGTTASITLTFSEAIALGSFNVSDLVFLSDPTDEASFKLRLTPEQIFNLTAAGGGAAIMFTLPTSVYYNTSIGQSKESTYISLLEGTSLTDLAGNSARSIPPVAAPQADGTIGLADSASSVPSATPTDPLSDQPISFATPLPTGTSHSSPEKPSALPNLTPTTLVPVQSEHPIGPPSSRPTSFTDIPTLKPSAEPLLQPTSSTDIPTLKPTAEPSSQPTSSTDIPTLKPTAEPSSQPTSSTDVPTLKPTAEPSSQPPSLSPTEQSTTQNCSLIAAQVESRPRKPNESVLIVSQVGSFPLHVY